MKIATKFAPGGLTSFAVAKLHLLESIKELIDAKIALHDSETNAQTRQVSWRRALDRVELAGKQLEKAIDSYTYK